MLSAPHATPCIYLPPPLSPSHPGHKLFPRRSAWCHAACRCARVLKAPPRHRLAALHPHPLPVSRSTLASPPRPSSPAHSSHDLQAPPRHRLGSLLGSHLPQASAAVHALHALLRLRHVTGLAPSAAARFLSVTTTLLAVLRARQCCGSTSPARPPTSRRCTCCGR